MKDAWTEAEDQMIIAGSVVVPGRTYWAVYQRRSKLGVADKRPVWTPEEDALLLAGQPVPGRSYHGVAQRLHKLGITRQKKPWTPEEEQLLQDGVTELPGRSPQAIKVRLRLIRRRK